VGKRRVDHSGRSLLAPDQGKSARRTHPRQRASGSGAVGLDPVIHERVRLGIVSALAVNEELSFNDLKKLLEITDGNLSVHARKLEEAGYVRCSRSFVGRQPRTEFKLTAAGRRALEGYLEGMESVIRTTRQG
jgi:DNA-binding HxlR family transcriptional regulator